jgi:flagellum-specific peptidoglycan hydrolase FlgJ
MPTAEHVRDGSAVRVVRITDAFTRYSSPEESWRDFGLYLTTKQTANGKPMYERVLRETEPEAFLRALERSAYQTDTRRGTLVSILRTNNVERIVNDVVETLSAPARQYTSGLDKLRELYGEPLFTPKKIRTGRD